jgi:hypothetical protein
MTTRAAPNLCGVAAFVLSAIERLQGQPARTAEIINEMLTEAKSPLRVKSHAIAQVRAHPWLFCRLAMGHSRACTHPSGPKPMAGCPNRRRMAHIAADTLLPLHLGCPLIP